MKITWLGHSCFLVEDSKGTKVIMDPFAIDPKLYADMGMKFGYLPLSGVQADIVLISHEHLDHNAAGEVGGSPAIIRVPGEYEVAGVTVRAVAGEHDPEEGRASGSNLIMRWEMDGVSLCHCGDFGQTDLRPEQIEALGRVDILFVPVGGDTKSWPTVNAEGAERIVDVLAPHLIFPMHFATPAVNFLQPVDHFLNLMSRVEKNGGSTVEVLPEQVLSLETTVLVLQYPKAMV